MRLLTDPGIGPPRALLKAALLLLIPIYLLSTLLCTPKPAPSKPQTPAHSQR
jgi:hypothetical protein